MTKIEFKIDGQVITKKNDKTVVEKSRNEYTAVFDFDDTWTDVENKQAYFTRYKDGLCVKADIDESGTCQVPWEVIEMPMFYVSVAGGDLKTVTRASVFVEQTGYSEDAEKSGTVPEVIRTPQSLLFKDNTISMLDRNGEAVGSGVTLPSGLRLINSITVADGKTATALKISEDVDGAKFSLHNIMFAARLNLSSSQNVTIRLRTDNGKRYLIYKAGVAANTIIFVSGESKVFNAGTYTNAEYLTSTTEPQGTISGNAFQTFASEATSKTNISDIEIFLYDTTNQFVELQPGTTLEVWGC